MTTTAAFLAAVLAGAACDPSAHPKLARGDSADLAARAAKLEEALARPDSGKPLARWVLPGSLMEVSGLALTADGRLFTHNDESARIFEIDYRRGMIIKEFRLGSPPIHGDFEGITVANGQLVLLSSNGLLYEFQEGDSGTQVAYKVFDTHLGQECEFEGIAFEATSNSLLLACKKVGKKSLQDFLVIYRWKREGDGASRTSLLKVPLSQAIGSNPWKTLHPSDLTIDPATGNYVLVAAQERALIELTPVGQVVSARPLPNHHDHAEGVAITRDHILLVSDEGGRRQAAITLYRWH